MAELARVVHLARLHFANQAAPRELADFHAEALPCSLLHVFAPRDASVDRHAPVTGRASLLSLGTPTPSEQ